MALPEDVSRYLERVVDELRNALGERLQAVYGLGGLALGDFRAGGSDVDVYAIVDGPLSHERKLSVAEACRHRRLPCPARKLELVVIRAAIAAAPGAAPDWELNLNTGEGRPDHVGVDPSAEPRHWFVVDLAVARQSGLTLFGPDARELIAAPEASAVRAAQREVVAWYARHGEAAEAVAAACRAWHWQVTGRFAAKREAVHWAAERLSAADGLDT